MNLFLKAMKFDRCHKIFLLGLFLFQILFLPAVFAAPEASTESRLTEIEKRLDSIEENQAKIIEGQTKILEKLKQVKIWIRRM